MRDKPGSAEGLHYPVYMLFFSLLFLNEMIIDTAPDKSGLAVILQARR